MESQFTDAQVHRHQVDFGLVREATLLLLEAIGEDITREGLRGTPERVARFWQEFIDYDAGNTVTTFERVIADQLVIVSGMRIWSLCEHHLLPFWCDVSVGYLTGTQVLGLSKFARIAENRAHGLQIQERLCEEIAHDVVAATGSQDVAVIAKGEHLCMTMRGIRKPAFMTSSVMRGRFRDEAALRAEFLGLVGGKPAT